MFLVSKCSPFICKAKSEILAINFSKVTTLPKVYLNTVNLCIIDTVNISKTHEGFVRKPKPFNNYNL